MKLREAWRNNYEAGSWRVGPSLRLALRRQCWDPNIALDLSIEGPIVIFVREVKDATGFALPWGATPEDMLADDWEAVP